jgi:hypothetical protein
MSVPTGEELHCQAASLLEAVSDLSPAYRAAAEGQPPEQAARALQARASGILMQHIGALSEASTRCSCAVDFVLQLLHVPLSLHPLGQTGTNPWEVLSRLQYSL